MRLVCHGAERPLSTLDKLRVALSQLLGSNHLLLR